MKEPSRGKQLEDIIAGFRGTRIRRSRRVAPSREVKRVDPFVRKVRLIATGAIALIVLCIASFMILRQAKTESGTQVFTPPVAVGKAAEVTTQKWSQDHSAGTAASDCLKTVMALDDSTLTHLRPLDGIKDRLREHRQELEELAAKPWSVGPFRVVQDSYLMLPVEFKGMGMRVAWFERTAKGEWLLDLDSFLGISDVPIPSLALSKEEGPFLLRGYSRPGGNIRPDTLELRAPVGEGKVRLRFDGDADGNLDLITAVRSTECPVMLMVSRLKTPLDGCAWKVDRVLGKEWFLPVDRRLKLENSQAFTR
ncbi:hypothetical protein KBB96_14200 [Luteolibacter ambystomatis]|uniref:Uncharacterized protein n=1 Tax=Luteolibacter ambystomatis TaxID=2824561 RepID=A0A975G753_9BACT|nr:hypothetical protein [Luteolibacter ambystomatis]QUE50015.1 hypothetical protein KBB96_14200 [Luteolibacter ambystomatis]